MICSLNNENNLIINVEEQYIKRVKIGKFGICEIPEKYNLESNKNIFLYTKYKKILWLKNKKNFYN